MYTCNVRQVHSMTQFKTWTSSSFDIIVYWHSCGNLGQVKGIVSDCCKVSVLKQYHGWQWWWGENIGKNVFSSMIWVFFLWWPSNVKAMSRWWSWGLRKKMKLSPLMSLPSLPFLLVLASPSLEPLEHLHLPHEQAGLSMSNLQQLWLESRAQKQQHQFKGRALKQQHQLEGRRALLQVARVVLCCPSMFAQLRFFRHILINLRACVQRQLMATKRKDEEVDPLDLGDGDIEMDYDKMDNLRAMLAKSSVAITYQVTRSNITCINCHLILWVPFPKYQVPIFHKLISSPQFWLLLGT